MTTCKHASLPSLAEFKSADISDFKDWLQVFSEDAGISLEIDGVQFLSSKLSELVGDPSDTDSTSFLISKLSRLNIIPRSKGRSLQAIYLEKLYGV